MQSYRIKFTHSIVCLVNYSQTLEQVQEKMKIYYPGNLVEWIEDRETEKEVYNIRDVVPMF